jgi:hypothetical protein
VGSEWGQTCDQAGLAPDDLSNQFIDPCTITGPGNHELRPRMPGSGASRSPLCRTPRERGGVPRRTRSGARKLKKFERPRGSTVDLSQSLANSSSLTFAGVPVSSEPASCRRRPALSSPRRPSPLWASAAQTPQSQGESSRPRVLGRVRASRLARACRRLRVESRR